MSLLILGLGNVLCGDDSVGPAVVERLTAHLALPADVTLLDGGTLGLALLPHLEAASEVIAIDAVQLSAAPGSLVRLEDQPASAALSRHLSCHQLGLAELLELARLRGARAHVVLLGIVPDRLDLGAPRSAAVEAALPSLTAAVIREAQQLGYTCSARQADGAPT